MSTYETKNKTLYQDADTANIPTDIRRIKALWAQVFTVGLQDAAYEFKLWASQKEPKKRELMSYPALYWMNSGEDYPGSFDWLCELFDLCPIRARSKWRENIRALLKEAKKCAEQELLAIELYSSPVSSELSSGEASKSAAPTKSESARKSKEKESSAPSTPRKDKSASTQRRMAQ